MSMFQKNHLHYQGQLISQQGIEPLLERVTAIEKLKEPNNIDELCQFPWSNRLLQEVHTIICKYIKTSK